MKSNPCCICSCENFCPIEYKGTCKIWVNPKSALVDVKEVKRMLFDISKIVTQDVVNAIKMLRISTNAVNKYLK